jgi:AcrR family transcriptional regulator
VGEAAESESSTALRRWESPGQQPRSHATQAAFLDAAEALFSSSGIEATSVNDVAKQARRSIGSLYHHFQKKEILVLAVVDRILGDLDRVTELRLRPSHTKDLGIPDIVGDYVQTALSIERGRPGYKRILIEVGLGDPQTRSAYKRFRQRLDGGLIALLLERRSEIGHSDPEMAARFVVDQLSAMLWARLDRVMTPTQLENHGDADFMAEALASVSAYLKLGQEG